MFPWSTCFFSFPSDSVGTDSAQWFRVKYWSVCRSPAHLSVEASVFSVYCSVQEGQTVTSKIFLCELDVIVHSVYMFCVGFHSPCSDVDPGDVHTPEPVAWSSSCEGNQGSALNFFCCYWGQQWAHGTAVLSVCRTSTCKIKQIQMCFPCMCITGSRRALFCMFSNLTNPT